jgi:hypothetical protein
MPFSTPELLALGAFAVMLIIALALDNRDHDIWRHHDD